MAPVIRVSDELYTELESMAVGFDTPAAVIERLMDAHRSNNDVRREPLPANTDMPMPKKSGRKKITETMALKAGKLGEQMFQGNLLNEAAKKVLVDMGMNSSSAHIYLYNFVAMRKGKVFKRGMKTEDIGIFLDFIEKRFGDAALAIAAPSLKLHIEYLEALGYSVPKRRALLNATQRKIRR